MDVSVIRENPERIREMLKNRNYPEELLNRFLEIDIEWRRLVDESNQLKRKRNEASHQIPKLKGEEKNNLVSEMKEVATRINQIDAKVAELENARNEVVLLIPNIPDATVPVGGCYDNNCCVGPMARNAPSTSPSRTISRSERTWTSSTSTGAPRSPEAASTCSKGTAPGWKGR